MPTRMRSERDRARRWQPSPYVRMMVDCANGRTVFAPGPMPIAIVPSESAAAAHARDYFTKGFDLLRRRRANTDFRQLPATPFPAAVETHADQPSLPFGERSGEPMQQWAAGLWAVEVARHALDEIVRTGASHRLGRCPRCRQRFIAARNGITYCRPEHRPSTIERTALKSARRAGTRH